MGMNFNEFFMFVLQNVSKWNQGIGSFVGEYAGLGLFTQKTNFLDRKAGGPLSQIFHEEYFFV